MTVTFELNVVSVSEIDTTLVIGFADSQVETTQYVLLQRSLDPENDDGVYVERDGQQYSTYGTIHSCSLTRRQISFILTPPLAEALELPADFAIRFACPNDVYDRLRVALQRMFVGTGCTLTV